MKKVSMLRIVVVISLSVVFFGYGYSQTAIEITKEELPSTLGTTWTTLNDTTENVIVDVGSPGENQQWEFTQSVEGIEIKQTVVSLDSTPFSSDFPGSDFVIKYEGGGLLDLIYSEGFPQIEGDIYFYQQITDTTVYLLGTGFSSSSFSGSAHFQPPNALLNFIPTRYNDEWITKSVFTIVIDTTIMGIPGQLKLSVNDSAHSEIDGWGKIVIPLGEFDCLRMKSYVTMDEQVTFNDIPIATKLAQIINYNWIAENYGIVMRVASHTIIGEPDDNFTDARLFVRMSSFTAGTTKVVDQINELPREFGLFQNYPNPFNPATTISYQIPCSGEVTLKIYNLLGEEITTLVEEEKRTGHFSAFWDGKSADGKGVTSGVYIYKIQVGEYMNSKKMLLLR